MIVRWKLVTTVHCLLASRPVRYLCSIKLPSKKRRLQDNLILIYRHMLCICNIYRACYILHTRSGLRKYTRKVGSYIVWSILVMQLKHIISMVDCRVWPYELMFWSNNNFKTEPIRRQTFDFNVDNIRTNLF